MAGGSPPPGNLQFTDILLPLQAQIAQLEGKNRRLKNQKEYVYKKEIAQQKTRIEHLERALEEKTKIDDEL